MTSVRSEKVLNLCALNSYLEEFLLFLNMQVSTEQKQYILMNLLGLSYRYLSMLFNLLRYHNNSLRYYNLHWISEKKNILRNRRIVGKRQVFHSSVMLILVAYFVTV